ncbi:MAG: hypothetical protein ABEI74_03570 [Candidatus Pacearchaeota archaeon]
MESETELKNLREDVEQLKRHVEELVSLMDVEPEVRPEYADKLKKIEEQGKFKKFSCLEG